MFRTLVYVAIVLCAASTLLMAQEAVPRAELFAGYQYFHANTGVGVSGIDSFNMNGWNASFTGYFNDYFGATMDFSGSYGTPDVLGLGISTKVHSFMGGPAVRYPNASKFTPFGHLLLGGGHVSASALGVSEKESDFAWAVGGGIDARINGRFSLRLGQLDFLQSRFLSDTQNNVRYSAGIVVHF